MSSGHRTVRWGIRNQILWPFAVVLLTAVALTAISAAWMAAQRSEREIADRQTRVLRTLGRTNFPWSQNVLEMMRGLSGAEFIVWDGGGEGGKRKAEGGNLAHASISEPAASTLPSSLTLERALQEQIQFRVAEAAGLGTDGSAGHEPLSESSVVQLGARRYFAAGLRRVSPRGVEQSLVALYPEDQLLTARRQAALPPLIVGGLTLIAMAVVAAWLAARFGRRIRTVQQQVALIAGGEFREMPIGTTRDEIFALVRSVNQMAAKLRGFQETIERTERSRLLGQLAGGLAHQLRNAVTGARLAIQLHQRRNGRGLASAATKAEVTAADAYPRSEAGDSDSQLSTLNSQLTAADNSLDVALRQLEITEEHIKGLLAVGRNERREPQPRLLAEVLDDVAALVSPVCRHENIDFQLDLCAGGVSPPHQNATGACCNTASGTVSLPEQRLQTPIGVNPAGATRPRHAHTADVVVSDSEAVRTAVLNLVLNAVDAAGPNGEVALRATRTLGASGSLHSTIEVVDNGPGPPNELKERLFEPFVTGKPEGVGLGLALVKQVADDLGGSVTWERSDGQTLFRFTIPVVPGKPGAPATGANESRVECQKLRASR